MCAYKADDGTEFTNKPMMTQHNTRMAAKRPDTKNPSKTEHSPAHETVTCPACHASFELHPSDATGNSNDTSIEQ